MGSCRILVILNQWEKSLLMKTTNRTVRDTPCGLSFCRSNKSFHGDGEVGVVCLVVGVRNVSHWCLEEPQYNINPTTIDLVGYSPTRKSPLT